MLVFVAGVLQSPSNGCAIPLRVLLLLLLDRSRISRALCHGSGSCLRGGSRDASPVCLRGMRVLGAARHPLDKRSGHFISWGWQRRCQNHRCGTAPSSLHPVGLRSGPTVAEASDQYITSALIVLVAIPSGTCRRGRQRMAVAAPAPACYPRLGNGRLNHSPEQPLLEPYSHQSHALKPIAIEARKRKPKKARV
jgi:hypothetical protein